MLLEIRDKFDFQRFKLYDEEDSNDTISNLMPSLLLYSTNAKYLKQDQGVDHLEVALSKLQDAVLRN